MSLLLTALICWIGASFTFLAALLVRYRWQHRGQR